MESDLGGTCFPKTRWDGSSEKQARERDNQVRCRACAPLNPHFLPGLRGNNGHVTVLHPYNACDQVGEVGTDKTGVF